MKKLTRICIVALIFNALASAQQAAPMSAVEIMNRVVKVYASCSSYLDEGQAKVAFRTRTQSRSFTTAFIRPANFRFEELFSSLGRKERNQFIAWKAGEQEKVWPPLIQTADATRIAPSISSVVHHSSERIVLALLLPDLFRDDDALNALADVTLTGQQSVDGRLTFRIVGNFKGQPISVWIDQQQFLVLKIQERIESHGLAIVTTTTFKPQINVEISPAKLAFSPPAVPTPIPGSSNVEVVNFSWSKKEQGSFFISPPPSPMDASLPTVEQGPFRTRPPSPETIASRFPFGRRRSFYRYELKIRNHSTREISGLAWDYVVMDLVNNKELGRHHLISHEKVKPTESRTLSVKAYSGPSKVINAGSVAGQPDSSPERVQIRCVLYADGSWWKDPSVKENECEYFRSTNLRKK